MSTIFSRIFGFKKSTPISNMPTCNWEPDPSIEAFSRSVWNELRGMPHMLTVVEEDALVDVIHHTYLYWRREDELGISLISYQTHDGHKLSLAGIPAATKLLECHRAIAIWLKSSAGG